MATKLSYDQDFPADCATVMGLLRNPDYVVAKGEATGSFDISVDVTDNAQGGVTITSTRSMPAEVPSYAKSFVGDTITITETQVWTAVQADGTASAAVTVDFNSPLKYTGQITLEGKGDGSVAHNTGEFKASVPFVGGKVEKVAAEQTERYLAKETKVAQEWLAR